MEKLKNMLPGIVVALALYLTLYLNSYFMKFVFLLIIFLVTPIDNINKRLRVLCQGVIGMIIIAIFIGVPLSSSEMNNIKISLRGIDDVTTKIYRDGKKILDKGYITKDEKEKLNENLKLLNQFNEIYTNHSKILGVFSLMTIKEQNYKSFNSIYYDHEDESTSLNDEKREEINKIVERTRNIGESEILIYGNNNKFNYSKLKMKNLYPSL